MAWRTPIPYKLQPTHDSMSFQTMPEGVTGLPLLPHPGAFGAVRKHHTHEGVDLYCPEGTPVMAVEAGTIVAIIPFTGPQVDMGWWHDTDAVMVEGATGVVLYGEITPEPLAIGQAVEPGDVIGHVKQVLVNDKGRPMSMLHLELYSLGTREAFEWKKWADSRPPALLDPTQHLIDCAAKAMMIDVGTKADKDEDDR